LIHQVAGVLEPKGRKINQRAPHRHTRESGYPEVFDFPGFRVALAIASLPGMTLKLFNGFQEHYTGLANPVRAGYLPGLSVGSPAPAVSA
jgi:hypothetical protein